MSHEENRTAGKAEVEKDFFSIFSHVINASKYPFL
jgi:hypothetical protein